MNRSWISKLSWVLCPAIVGTLALAACTTAQAGNLAKVIMEGRKQGDTAWASALTVAPNDVIEYRLRADLGEVGATNGTNTITSTANSGFNTLSLQVKQDAAAPIQVNFRPPLSDPNGLASFKNGWADGPGASAGAPTARPGSANMDITGIRPVHSPGVFSGVDPEDIVSGSTFQVASAGGGSTTLMPSWGTVSGALRINGAGQIFVTTTVQNSADPIVGFTGLTLNAIPEPSTIALIGMGLVGLVAVARRRRTA